MKRHMASPLTGILEALDASVASAVAEPQLAGGHSLERAHELCLSLKSEDWIAPGDDAKARERAVARLWEIRSRLGRLKLLLDSAGDFYGSLSGASDAGAALSECFSSGMDYDVEGEWKAKASGGLLSVNC